VKTFKYLGAVFDNFMIWKAHADYLCKKVANRVSQSLGVVEVLWQKRQRFLFTI